MRKRLFSMLLLLCLLIGVVGCGNADDVPASGLVKESSSETVVDEDSITFISGNSDEDNLSQGGRNIVLCLKGAYLLEKTEDISITSQSPLGCLVVSANASTRNVKVLGVLPDTYLHYKKLDGTEQFGRIKTTFNYHLNASSDSEKSIKEATTDLGENLDLAITDYISIGYSDVMDIINEFGGVNLDVSSDKKEYINCVQKSLATILDCEYTEIIKDGYQHLNGMQALAYGLINQFSSIGCKKLQGDAYLAASVQLELLRAVVEAAQSKSIGEVTEILDKCINNIDTNMTSEDIAALLVDYDIADSELFPIESMRVVANMGVKGSCLIPLDLEPNVKWLHEFLFDDKDFQVSDTVKEYSKQIKEDTEPYIIFPAQVQEQPTEESTQELYTVTAEDMAINLQRLANLAVQYSDKMYWDGKRSKFEILEEVSAGTVSSIYGIGATNSAIHVSEDLDIDSMYMNDFLDECFSAAKNGVRSITFKVVDSNIWSPFVYYASTDAVVTVVYEANFFFDSNVKWSDTLVKADFVVNSSDPTDWLIYNIDTRSKDYDYYTGEGSNSYPIIREKLKNEDGSTSELTDEQKQEEMNLIAIEEEEAKEAAEVKNMLEEAGYKVYKVVVKDSSVTVNFYKDDFDLYGKEHDEVLNLIEEKTRFTNIAIGVVSVSVN